MRHQCPMCCWFYLCLGVLHFQSWRGHQAGCHVSDSHVEPVLPKASVHHFTTHTWPDHTLLLLFLLGPSPPQMPLKLCIWNTLPASYGDAGFTPDKCSYLGFFHILRCHDWKYQGYFLHISSCEDLLQNSSSSQDLPPLPPELVFFFVTLIQIHIILSWSLTIPSFSKNLDSLLKRKILRYQVL